MEISTKINWKDTLKIPNKEMDRLSKIVKEDLQGIMVKDNQMYITDSFYAFTKPLEQKDGFISAVTGKVVRDCPEIATQLVKFFKEHKGDYEFNLSLDVLERVVSIMKVQNELKGFAYQNKLHFSVSKDNSKPLLVTQGTAKYLIMPQIK